MTIKFPTIGYVNIVSVALAPSVQTKLFGLLWGTRHSGFREKCLTIEIFQESFHIFLPSVKILNQRTEMMKLKQTVP